jgi:hypothetical protein
MPKEKKPEVDPKELQDQVEKDPRSKKWNNENSRRNLKQYRDEAEEDALALVPEVEDGSDEDAEAQLEAEAITVGRKLDPKLVKRLIPKRGVLSLDEVKRFRDIVLSFLSDFKNEEPTASDIDDIFEISMCTIMDTKLLKAAKDSPDAVISISKASESYNKRKQKAKENLASRRSDRKNASLGQDISIVDLAARYDKKRQEAEMDRVRALLEKEAVTDKALKDIVREEIF